MSDLNLLERAWTVRGYRTYCCCSLYKCRINSDCGSSLYVSWPWMDCLILAMCLKLSEAVGIVWRHKLNTFQKQLSTDFWSWICFNYRPQSITIYQLCGKSSTVGQNEQLKKQGEAKHTCLTVFCLPAVWWPYTYMYMFLCVYHFISFPVSLQRT